MWVFIYNYPTKCLLIRKKVLDVTGALLLNATASPFMIFSLFFGKKFFGFRDRTSSVYSSPSKISYSVQWLPSNYLPMFDLAIP